MHFWNFGKFLESSLKSFFFFFNNFASVENFLKIKIRETDPNKRVYGPWGINISRWEINYISTVYVIKDFSETVGWLSNV